MYYRNNQEKGSSQNIAVANNDMRSASIPTKSLEAIATVNSTNTNVSNYVGISTTHSTSILADLQTPISTKTLTQTRTPLPTATRKLISTKTPTLTPSPYPSATPSPIVASTQAGGSNQQNVTIDNSNLDPTPDGDYVQILSLSPPPGTILNKGDIIQLTVRYQIVTVTYPDRSPWVRISVARFETEDCSWGFLGKIDDKTSSFSEGKGEFTQTFVFESSYGQENIKAFGLSLVAGHGPNTLFEDLNYAIRCYPIATELRSN